MEILKQPAFRTQHKCSVCGEYSEWTPYHRYAERIVGMGMGSYEISFVVCSELCHQKSETSFVKWLGGQTGWSKKSASQNWNETIKNSY